MDLLTYCSLSGVCYDLATQFLLRVPWDKVLKDGAAAGVKKMWSSRSAYALVLKEAELSQEVYIYFKNTIEKISRFQDMLGVNICSLSAAKEFLKDFEKVLKAYDPENISKWQTNVAGEALRTELQRYVTFMHAMMSNISLELQYVTMQLQAIQLDTSIPRKKHMMEMLRTSCVDRYGIPEISPPDQEHIDFPKTHRFSITEGYGSEGSENGDEDDEDIFSDASSS